MEIEFSPMLSSSPHEEFCLLFCLILLDFLTLSLSIFVIHFFSNLKLLKNLEIIDEHRDPLHCFCTITCHLGSYTEEKLQWTWYFPKLLLKVLPDPDPSVYENSRRSGSGFCYVTDLGMADPGPVSNQTWKFSW